MRSRLHSRCNSSICLVTFSRTAKEPQSRQMVCGDEFEAEPHEIEAEVLGLYRNIHSHGTKYS